MSQEDELLAYRLERLETLVLWACELSLQGTGDQYPKVKQVIRRLRRELNIDVEDDEH